MNLITYEAVQTDIPIVVIFAPNELTPVVKTIVSAVIIQIAKILLSMSI